ncbi:hypothetical protein H5407_04615 [Mitsuaria sp. WAJ17]|uniref:DUF6882 domain-containing protein n=1 Tax=Mitsuaria sp. WAJ17 TaxID=2761452 RepID=UPI00160174CB|nr:DUF6882 domain-containing protein [Mitsuaria sp. WAJ17]MBB2484506.1 hypothetical protein [Mitsuaria sp. WAJ17]
MNEEAFEAFRAEANEELQAKQASLQAVYNLSAHGRWWFDQEAETLQFFDAQDRLRVEADVIHVGSYSRRSDTWLWAWANVSLLPKLRAKAEALRALESATGYAVFGEADTFEADEPMAWELAAIAVKHLDAMGCYRAPNADESCLSFLALVEIRTVQ